MKSIINKLKKKYRQKYGFAVFDVEIIKTKNGKFEISGKVLTKNQKNETLKNAEKFGMEIKKENIKILSDINKRFEIGWAVVKDDLANLKSRFISNKIINKKILKRIKCSEVFKGEIVRILIENEDQFLVQQNDLTLGWIDKNKLTAKKKNLLCKWSRDYFLAKNKTIKSIVSKNTIIREAEKFIGVNYVLGGRSKFGIDCSGLVQIVYKNSLGVILPRHSWDQKEIGKKIKLENIESGDLIFLIKKKNKRKHIGITEVIKKDKNNNLPKDCGANGSAYKINLIHASLSIKKVARQKLKEVLKNYDFVEARRIIENKN